MVCAETNGSVLQVSLEETGIFEVVNGSAGAVEVSHVMLVRFNVAALAYLSITKAIKSVLGSFQT